MNYTNNELEQLYNIWYNIAKFRESERNMPKGTNQSDTHYCNNNLTRNAMFRGDYTTKPKI